MTNQWFRSWHGAPTDPKWLGIARKANIAPGIVSALVWALLDRASQATVRGSVAGYDADGLACFMGCETEQVEHVIALMHEKGILIDNAFSGWEKHQPKREDENAKERSRKHRNAKKQDETQCNAMQRTETLDTDTDTDNKTIAPVARVPDRFDEFYAAYPKRVSRGQANRAFKTAISKTSADTIIAAARVFAAKQVGKDKQFIPHPATWLNGECWADETLATSQPISGNPQVFVEENTAAWLAWERYRGKRSPSTENRATHKRGWHFPTEFPPEDIAA